MPAPCPRHSCQIVDHSPRHARATPVPQVPLCGGAVGGELEPVEGRILRIQEGSEEKSAPRAPLLAKNPGHGEKNVAPQAPLRAKHRRRPVPEAVGIMETTTFPLTGVTFLPVFGSPLPIPSQVLPVRWHSNVAATECQICGERSWNVRRRCQGN
eukprot:gene13244-biopygen5012